MHFAKLMKTTWSSLVTLAVKIISAISDAPSMYKEEVNEFLESKLLLQIGTIDDEGDPNIHPVWFGYDIDRE